MSVSIALHLLSAILWVGGMMFAHMMLRPAAVRVLEPPLRLKLWVQVFKNFFLWVWIAIITILASGYWMVFGVFNGFGNVGIHIHLMHGMGIVMVLIFMYVFFIPYRKLRHAVIVENFQEGGAKLAQIRQLVGINILIGLGISIIASAGRYL
ncbi:MAG: CopD family protein [Gammaproteobacteria bacterium]|nr:CopD family protein [Gammaproteobacteria bacterium]